MVSLSLGLSQISGKEILVQNNKGTNVSRVSISQNVCT